MKNARLVVAVALLITVAGCKSYPTYFVDRAPMTTGTRLGLDQAYIAPDAAATMTSRTLMVQVIDMRKSIVPGISKVGRKTDLGKLRPALENVLADVVWRTRVFSDVSLTSDIQPIKHPDLRLEAAVTGWDEGSGWLRFLFGIASTPFRSLGTGPTRIQWEGRMIDTRSGAVVMQFADTRIHPGGPSILLSLKPFRATLLLEEDLMASIGILAEGMREVCSVSAPMMSRAEMHPRFHRQAARSPGVRKTTP